ncbi:NAD(P)H-dependent oxidoreductase [Candidatus Pacearchaeota archaeon]|nr:NAD(P)H-dependent oxidoreductase [Candidatus Pacearchaeota archaeon]
MEHKNFIGALNWRYATKQFDTAKKVSKKDLNELLESARLSASSFGLQPWKFVVVEDKKTREKLREVGFGQPQITDASHLIVLCSIRDVDGKYIRKYIENIAKIRGISADMLKGFEDTMIGFSKQLGKQAMLEWAKKQTYIALGTLLSACALKKIDASPMEGFNPVEFDKILGLEKLGLASAVLCAVGYRSEKDENAKYKKVRFDMKDIVIKK